jgi:hypothetical protein
LTNWTPIPLASQSYQAASLPASAQRLLNMYAEPLPGGAASAFMLLPTPGLSLWAETGSGANRGIHAMGGDIYVISGEELYAVDEDAVATLIGTIPGTQQCHMIDNGTHVGIAADAAIYAANRSGITWVNGKRATGAAYQDGYGIYAIQASQQFDLTGLDDLTTVDPLDFTTVDGFTDSLVACISDHRELMMLKERSTEFYTNTGNASFPFERTPGGFIERGCASSISVAKNEHRVTWLGDDLAVYATQGYQPQRISTGPIEALIAGASDPHTASGFAYSRNGHSFYVLGFSDLTVCYDFATGLWHERATYGEDRWRGQNYQRFSDMDLVGDFETGNIYQLDDAVYTDNGVAIQRTFTSAVIQGGGGRFVTDEVLLEAEAGVGNDGDGDDTDPSLFLRCTDDGGRTFSTPREAKLGQLGEYGRVVNWTRLGMARNRILEFSTRASVKVAAHACRGRFGAAA